MLSHRSASVPATAAAPKRNHLLLMVAFFFLIGCVTVRYVSGGAWLWALAAMGAAIAVLARRMGLSPGIGVAVVCFALGSLHAHHALDLPMPEPGTYEITGFVYGGCTERDDRRITFALGNLTLNGEPVPGKAYCSLRWEEAPPALFDGAQLRFSGRVYRPEGKSGEPRMDFHLWARQQGYRFGIALYEEPLVENSPDSAPVRDAAYRVRQRLSAALERVMGPNARIAMALLFGQREGLTQEESAAFKKLGIAHVMSVSGLHVGLLGGLLMLALRRMSVGRRTGLALLSEFLLGYCALTGFSAASVRAAVMLVCASVGRLFLRRGDRLTTLAAAMLFVLVLDPLSALSAGFVLSFGAMLGITLFGRSILNGLNALWPQPSAGVRRGLPRARPARVQLRVKELLAVSLAAQLGVLLPSMRFFHQLPLYGVLINLLIVPLTGGVLVPLYAAALLCSPLPLAGAALGGAASLATEVLLWLVRLLSRLPYAAIRTAAPPVLVCVGLGAAMLLLSNRVPGSLRRRAAASALVACVALGAWALQRPAGLRYLQLSVGQADCALLLDGDKTILIDTGPDGLAALDYLLDENRDVDALILTHLHLDHAGGVAALLESGVKIRQVYLPAAAWEQQLEPESLAVYQLLLSQDIPLSTLASGDELRYNRSTIRVLWPDRRTVRAGQNANHYSLALSIDLDGFTLLNAGDLSGLYERYAAAPADILKLAHHGSAESSSDPFLAFVRPRYALLSVSGANRLLPSPQTLERLARQGIDAFRTDECGDITLSVRDGQLLITPYKERNTP